MVKCYNIIVVQGKNKIEESQMFLFHFSLGISILVTVMSTA